jgi:hypothetical protein
MKDGVTQQTKHTISLSPRGVQVRVCHVLVRVTVGADLRA